MESDLGESIFFILAISTPGIFALVFLILALILCSALISGSEIAFFSLDPNDIQSLEQEGSAKSKKILGLKEKPRKLLATILISNNFVNIAIILISNFLLGRVLPDQIFYSLANSLNDMLQAFSSLSVDPDKTAGVLQFIITVVGVTFVLVLFGEITPKIYANINNIRLAKIMANPLSLLSVLFLPFSTTMVNWSIRLEKRLIKDRSSSIKEDIDHAIELTVKNDQNSEEEVDILKGIVKFSDVTAKQIMCSRVDVVAVEDSATFEEVLHTIRESGFSRIPIYHEDFDHITGILYVKDLLGTIDKQNFKWQKLVRKEVLYTPEYRKINELLKDFQHKRMHMAIVVDEYGGSAGLVTLEDVMEEVIGEIKDEFDEKDEIDFIQLDKHNFIFDGKSMINDVSRIIGANLDELDEIRGDADSLAGLILENTGSMPKLNRTVAVGPFVFKVLSVNKRRIEKIQITYNNEQT